MAFLFPSSRDDDVHTLPLLIRIPSSMWNPLLTLWTLWVCPNFWVLFCHLCCLSASHPLSWTHDAVHAGIAWDAKKERLFVTGKYWPRMFQVKLKPLNPHTKGSKSKLDSCYIQS